MMIPPVQGFGSTDLAALQPATTSGGLGASAGADSQSPFLDSLKSAIGTADQLGNGASQQVNGVLTGSGGDIHSAMIAVEKADLSFQMMMQVRNKMVQAYQEISRMAF